MEKGATKEQQRIAQLEKRIEKLEHPSGDVDPGELFEMEDKEKMVEILKKARPGIEFLAFGDFDTKTVEKILDAYRHWRLWKHEREEKGG